MVLRAPGPTSGCSITYRRRLEVKVSSGLKEGVYLVINYTSCALSYRHYKDSQLNYDKSKPTNATHPMLRSQQPFNLFNIKVTYPLRVPRRPICSNPCLPVHNTRFPGQRGQSKWCQLGHLHRNDIKSNPEVDGDQSALVCDISPRTWNRPDGAHCNQPKSPQT